MRQCARVRCRCRRWRGSDTPSRLTCGAREALRCAALLGATREAEAEEQAQCVEEGAGGAWLFGFGPQLECGLHLAAKANRPEAQAALWRRSIGSGMPVALAAALDLLTICARPGRALGCSLQLPSELAAAPCTRVAWPVPVAPWPAPCCDMLRVTVL